eukprot:CAMPEP_0170327452 /NCGR_PEP_ID=MMETSP0116_2-20130129/64617_1 /TAXON_ID=400756 /ORGANISM="Durinskia baltica, Strain CSIRO CS-38" /LENGTH=43 /DNA_ID= /DNA_START= /DNA_END= /DNA_ORIENTATION=
MEQGRNRANRSALDKLPAAPRRGDSAAGGKGTESATMRRARDV